MVKHTGVDRNHLRDFFNLAKNREVKEICSQSSKFKRYPKKKNTLYFFVSDTEFINREPGVGILKFNALTHAVTTLLTEAELVRHKK